jgi:hypothetical protein
MKERLGIALACLVTGGWFAAGAVAWRLAERLTASPR